MTTLEEMIANGQKKRDEETAKLAEIDASRVAYAAAQEQELKGFVFALIPDALHPYAKILDEKILEIDAPGCARITCGISVDKSRVWEGALKEFISKVVDADLELRRPDEGWTVRQWAAYQDDGDWVAWPFRVDHEFIDDIETALALAAEIGDNRVKVEEDVAQKNMVRILNMGAENVDRPTLICPLLVGDCIQGKCALWVSYRGCAIQAIAENGVLNVD